jgi:group I intron endonuclease
MKNIVYLHKNKINEKCYVGQTGQKIENRWKKEGRAYLDIVTNGKYKHPKFAPAILKYGWNNFDHIILAENLSLKESNRLEKEMIIKYNSFNNGYNSTIGGDGSLGIKRSKEQIKKHSEFMKGKLKGSKNGSSRKIKCVETGKIFGSLSEACEEYNLNYNSFHSNLNKAIKNNYSCCGYHWEYQEPLKRKEIKVTRNVNAKKVRCIETGEVFNSALAASNKKNLIASHITRSIKKNWKHGGYNWEYI